MTSRISSPSRRRRVVVIDDQAIYRTAITRCLHDHGGFEVVAAVGSVAEGLAAIRDLTPDIVTLDLELPDGSGLELLMALPRNRRDLTIVVFSSDGAPGAEVTVRALELGAAEFVCKGNRARGLAAINDDLIPKLVALEKRASPSGLTQRLGSLLTRSGTASILAIASSTGGPKALAQALAAFPPDFPAPILIAQHMPAGFTASLATHLDQLCHLTVCEAAPGMLLAPGTVILAPGDQHMTVQRSPRGLKVALDGGERVNGVRPAADVLYRSLVEAGQARETVAAIFTGMGRDGTAGAQLLAQGGATVVTQSAASCVVFGMPRAAEEAGLSQARFEPERLHQVIAPLFRRGR